MTTTSVRYMHISNIKSIYDIFDVSEFRKDSDKDGISDYYEKQLNDGTLLLGDGTTIDGLKIDNPDTDGDGLLDGEELYVTSIETSTDDGNVISTVYVRMYSNPTMMDTDGDGYTDSEDEHPLIWDVSDRDLVMLSQLAYSNLFSVGTLIENDLSQDHKFYGGTATMAEMKGWELAHSSSKNDDAMLGFYGVTYKKDDNYVIAFRGSEAHDLMDIIQDWIIADIQGILLNQFNYQAFIAQQYVDKIIDQISDLGDNKIFITGHSLGGYLAQIATIKFYNYDEYQDNIKKSVNFNAPGINDAMLESLTNIDKISNCIENWRVKDEKYFDIVSSFNEKIGTTYTVKYGDLTNKEYTFFLDLMNAHLIGTHMLNSFLEDDKFKTTLKRLY